MVLIAFGPIAAATQEARGPVTNLPLPRYVSMKAAEGNVRRGPSLTHRIDWVFKRRGMPLQITAEYGNWRKVQDRDGAGGWVHYALLSGVRTVLIESDMLPVYARPDPNSPDQCAFRNRSRRPPWHLLIGLVPHIRGRLSRLDLEIQPLGRRTLRNPRVRATALCWLHRAIVRARPMLESLAMPRDAAKLP